MGRHVEVDGAAPIMAQYYEDVQNLKADCGHDQEILSLLTADVVLKKRAPRL